MKKNLLLLLVFLVTLGMTNAQNSAKWSEPMYQVSFKADTGEEAKMEIDKGYRYADLDFDGRVFHLFFNGNVKRIKQARILEPKTNLQVARGKGSYFWGNARFEFVDGEVYKIKRKYYSNGYEIIGPYGTLFKVENHAISPVKPINEKDFLAQAFFVFERIRVTQSNPTDVMIYNSSYGTFDSNE